MARVLAAALGCAEIQSHTEGENMRNINSVFLMGRLGADPVVRQTKTNRSMVLFSIATHRRVQGTQTPEGQSVEPTEETHWHDIVAWGRTGEICAAYLRKGRSVLIQGTLMSRKYTAKDGTQKKAVEIWADDVTFLDGARKLGAVSNTETPAESPVDIEQEEVANAS